MEFQGSIAQENVQFPIESVIEPIPGENYSKVMIFMPLSLAATYLPGVDSPAAKTLTKLNASNYANIAGGLLLTWLVPFFTAATSGEVGIVIYDDGESATLTLDVVYEAFKMYAYFKFIIAGSEDYAEAQVALSTLCRADPLYSDCHIGTDDANTLTKTSTLITNLKNADSNARVIYNSHAAINPALAQVGRSLAETNASGTPVGNSIDMVAFGTIKPSGTDDADGNGTNLSATQKLNLDDQKIGYDTYVGDGTENVSTEGSLTLKGESVGANWVKNYITYMCKVKTAAYITQMNKFRNNSTYQAILLILSDIVRPFLEFGRLQNFEITAPAFADLPQSADTITVNNAWKATYVDDTREVTVYGTLYIPQATR
jgi:hypothetical protein